jgi:cell division protein FtsA|tara:strand:- start:909 stop:2153 length:1245 start_codon:yes stop_codon:yes gene_type:complete
MPSVDIITVIDIGTTKICTIVAKNDIHNNVVDIIGYSFARCEGLKKGNIENIELTSEAISQTLLEIKKSTGITPKSAYVGITGSHINYMTRVDSFDNVGTQGVITAEEVRRIPQSILFKSHNSMNPIIHSFTKSFTVDGQEGIGDPTGMHATGFDVTSLMVTAGQEFTHKIEKAMEGAGITVKGFVLNVLGSAQSVLTPRDKTDGAAVIDIGSGTTDILVFNDGHIENIDVIPVGGFQFTNDIVLTYNTTYSDAESVKLKFANTEPSTIDISETLSLAVTNSVSTSTVYRRDLCQLIRERALELIRLIDLKLMDTSMSFKSNPQIVITGGSALLPGFLELFQQFMPKFKISIGNLGETYGIPDELKTPLYAAGVGIMQFACFEESRLSVIKKEEKSLVLDSSKGFINKMKNMFN